MHAISLGCRLDCSNIKEERGKYMCLIKKKKYAVRVENDGTLMFQKNNKDFFSVPASACVNERYSHMQLISADEDTVVFSSRGNSGKDWCGEACTEKKHVSGEMIGVDNEEMIFELLEDCVRVRYFIKTASDMPIYQAKMFTNGHHGMEVIGFDRAFCPQPRNNMGKNMDYYHHLPDISQNGYFSPPAMEISIGSKEGWVSIGLLDLPDSKICRMEEDHSFLVESCGGNKVISAGEVYRMPELLITFPSDEWDAVTIFRNKLTEFGKYTPSKPKYSELPEWWKNPFVCTYGDQLIEHRVGQKINADWVNAFVKMAEEDWGMEHINLIIDDSWQLPHAFEPMADEKRFPDFRGFIDKLHQRGHHVILWQTPLFDKITNGFKTRAERLGVLSKTAFKPPLWGEYFSYFPGCYAIDYTADHARQFVKEIVEVMFGDKPGQYNADGIKMDFLGLLRDPAEVQSYAHPEKGLGLKELLLFYEMFYEEAKKVKPDVLIDATVGDPRFEHILDFNRLHDTHSGVIEKEMRARLVTLGCPDLPIDSDGALMFNSWLKNHYIGAALYAVPSNYYLDKYDDVRVDENGAYIYGVPDERKHLSPDEKKQFGILMKMVKYRPDGYAHMESFGNWVLKDGEQVNGLTQRGETVVYYPTEKNDTGYLFTFQDEVIIIPLHGRKFSGLSPAPRGGYLMVDYARDQAIMRLVPGMMYTFKNEDNGESVDRVFSKRATTEVEKEMNYVN